MLSSRVTSPATIDGAQTSTTEKLSGTGAAFDIGIGGSVGKGVILAGDFGALSHEPSSSGDVHPQGKIRRLGYTRLGVLLDWYLSPTGGFHVQGGAAIASANYRRNAGFAVNDSHVVGGMGFHLGAGYEGWVGDDWGLGGLMAKLSDSDDQGDHELTLMTPSVLLTATFN
jgi:hypothetical protein